ncbi:precorrin-6A synthase (deacetylating) [Pseudonocardia yuanmonensis]|uniref:Precorrin-6A synthase (Deacetylating) n=1 Tax=Pseudonocardia yuanmonensis TaxID=1095914 RepID=A0ABP8X0P8_9PSEU
MRTVYVIGIGSGDPDHLTLQAVAALKRVDVVFVIDKGEVKEDLTALRTEILHRHLDPGSYRVVEAADPERDRRAGAGEAGRSERYTAAVVDWQDRRGSLYGSMIAELADGETGAFLVWGDPSLYDGTLRLLEGIEGIEVVSYPGISSVQALAAAHRLILNRVGRPVLITTGRRIAAGLPADVDDIVVMLDGGTAFAQLPDDEIADVEVYWGAYVGSPDELLVSGPVLEVRDEIVRLRAEARERKGWIMDTYLLRRHPGDR